MTDSPQNLPENREPVLRKLEKRLGDLRIRLKLMVFHNVFFSLLAVTIYMSVIPVLEHRLTGAYQRESQMMRATLASNPEMLRQSSSEIEYSQGSPAQLGMPQDIQAWVETHPGEVWFNPEKSAYLYHKDRSSDLYRRVKLPREQYRDLINNARWALTIVLISTYLLGVLVLEFLVLPVFVYRPIQQLLDADSAASSGDRERELVPEREIPDDELGDLMRSRNRMLSLVRQHEDALAEALHREEALTADLLRKNAQLEAAKRSLADQDRLVSLGLMSASVAHELNTPLAVLKGSIDKLLEGAFDETTRARLHRMQRVADRLRSISSSLLDFARVRRTEMAPVDLRQLIEECWDLVSIDDKASRVHFHNRVDPRHWVQGNADRLSQVFVNLLRNALHEITVSGNIWVSSSIASAVEWREHPGETSTAGGRVVIRVEDDGAGIPESVLPHLFEAFVSTRLDAHGTGLGLTVAEGIIQQHQGAIRAYNRGSGGACLEVELPAASPVAAETPAV
jgi:signal transduction histidine kinase